jgi:dihydrofolate reductase
LAGDLIDEVKKLKEGPQDVTILGSGSIVSQLTQAGLIDEFNLVIHPIVLGAGRTLFENIESNVRLTLTGSRVFKNGNMLLNYIPAN